MKKVLFAAVAVFGFITTQAQEIKFGAKAGLNGSTLIGDAEDAKMIIGAHVGAFAEIKINDKFSFQPELLFSMQGAKSEYSESEEFGGDIYSYSEESKVKLNYLNVPLMAKYYATQKFYVEAGPQIGFLISAKSDYEYTELINGSVDYSESEDGFDVKDNFKSVDFGFNFGLGYEFTENIFTGVRYNLGLSDITDITGFDDKVKNGVFQVSFGYKF